MSTSNLNEQEQRTTAVERWSAKGRFWRLWVILAAVVVVGDFITFLIAHVALPWPLRLALICADFGAFARGIFCLRRAREISNGEVSA
jgi:hypothetical protein